MIELYTDGSALGNPGPGGYGVVLKSGPYYKELSMGYRKTTNNRMELLAVIVGLEALKTPGQEVLVTSDSQYVINSIEKGWVLGWEKKGFVKRVNADLWKRYLVIGRKHKVKFKWVRGHTGHAENERCDKIAVLAANNPTEVDEGFERAEGGNLGSISF